MEQCLLPHLGPSPQSGLEQGAPCLETLSRRSPPGEELWEEQDLQLEQGLGSQLELGPCLELELGQCLELELELELNLGQVILGQGLAPYPELQLEMEPELMVKKRLVSGQRKLETSEWE